MIIADFGIICIGQKQCTYPKGIENICIEACRRDDNSEAMYNSYYNFHTADGIVGCWYFIWPKEEILYEKPFFDLGSRGSPWVTVVQEWAEMVQKVLEFYIEQSPENKVAVLIREQDKSNDIIHTTLKIDEFVQNLVAGDIRWNELYFVVK